MKKILALLTAVTTLGFAVPSTSQAFDRCGTTTRIVNYLPCGRPIYAHFQIYGYDHFGNPHGRWVTQSVNCGCHVCVPPLIIRQPLYHSGGYSGGGFSGGDAACRPGASGSGGVPSHHGRSSFFRFGR